MKNSQAKNILINKEGCRCLLTGYSVQREQLTFHHIIKKEWGGQATPENGANLIGSIHNWLHCAIEHNDKELFYLINECLLLYKDCLDKDLTELIAMFENECQPLFAKEVEQPKQKMKHKSNINPKKKGKRR